ncbi:MAG: polyphenol oxidase family protein [Verrucomicrobiaceae bacterium]
MSEASLFLSPILSHKEIRADFIPRIPGVPTSTNKEETLALLEPHHQEAASRLGFPKTYLAEQVHGSQLALITPRSPLLNKGVDGLLTNQPGCLLGIHVADCGAIYLLDQKTKALALLHSGKKGTDLNILGHAVTTMTREFGTHPADLIAVLGPCIRPPHYEIDFADTIRQQALHAGIPAENYHDCGLCTASDPDHFYSYRLEKGNTGRMIALLGRVDK